MAYKPTGRVGGIGSARPQRLFQVLSILWEQAFANEGRDGGAPDCTYEWMTTGQIAREMGMATSPQFRGLLDELYGQGLLSVEVKPYRANMQVYVWSIAEDARWSRQWKASFDAWLDPEGVLA